MDENTRVYNSKKNIVYGFLCQMITILLSFANRQVFIILLGSEYLGINGLFSNILTVLSLAEMGIGNTFLFFLYKPIRDQNYMRIQALLKFCKRLFYCVALIVFLIGSAVIPLLSFIVDVSININQIRLYYVLYLLNSVLSYFSVNRTMALEAYQKNYVTSLCKTVIMILQNLGQIAILLYSHNYLWYLLVQIGCTVFYNIYVTYKAVKMYPHIFQNSGENLPENEKKYIWTMIKSTFIYKAGVILMNNTDNILISIIIATVSVGYYSNYKMVEMVIVSFINVLIKAITASLGDLNAENNIEHSLNTFRTLLFIFHAVTAFCSICLLSCLNDFIYLWIGSSYVLNIDVTAALVFCFYISNIVNPVWVYRETMGLYKETKYLMLIAAFINLILSIILGVTFGLSGIIIATGLARVLTTVWYEPRILFGKMFKENVNTYYIVQMKYVVQTGVCILVVFISTLNISVSFWGMMLKVMITFMTVSLVFIVCNRKTEEYKNVKEIIKKIMRRYKKV